MSLFQGLQHPDATPLALTLGGTPLLESVELFVSAGERVCLVSSEFSAGCRET